MTMVLAVETVSSVAVLLFAVLALGLLITTQQRKLLIKVTVAD
jgi:hypothetical protein